MLALELHLDPESESTVRALWTAIDALGVPSLGSALGADYQPHVSLAVFAEVDPSTLVTAFAPVLGSCSGLPLTLTSLGFFVGSGSVAFLGVTPTERLLDTHRRVHAALADVVEESWSIYQPGTWVPHCTLAMNVDHPDRLLGLELQFPIPAVAAEAHVVEISSGRSIVRLV
ncbi:MAG TPA: 2'-5' RNA ligase family protein [Actinomycetes bacterium]|nr:2'-5' RNA ligase family protein [Actinomycetes bacterium]